MSVSLGAFLRHFSLSWEKSRVTVWRCVFYNNVFVAKGNRFSLVYLDQLLPAIHVQYYTMKFEQHILTCSVKVLQAFVWQDWNNCRKNLDLSTTMP